MVPWVSIVLNRLNMTEFSSHLQRQSKLYVISIIGRCSHDTGLSKVAGCWRKSLPTLLVLAGYSAWHFFMDGVF